MNVIQSCRYKIHNKFMKHSKSFKSKLFISYLIIIFVSLALYGIIVHYISSKELEIQSNNYTSLLLEKYIEDLEQTINELDRITKVSLINQNILNILSNPNSIYSNNDYQLIENYMIQIMTLRLDIDKVYLTDLKDHTYTFGYNNFITSDYDIKKEDWYAEFEKSPDLFMIVSPYFNKSVYNYNVLSVVRKIKDPLSDTINGLIKIDIKTNFLKELNSINTIEDSTLILLDQFNTPIYTNNNVFRETDLINILDKAEKNSGHFAMNTGLDKYVVTYKKSNYTNWNILLIIPKKTFLSKISIVNTEMFITGLLCAVLAIVFSLKLSYSISKSLLTLSKAMRVVEGGNLTTSITLTSKDEFGFLAKGFNNMILKLNELMKLNAEVKAKETEAKIKALQSQINPHFIYNTLETVRMKAITNQPEEASLAIEALGQLLRHTLDNRHEFVDLGTELNYIKMYINLYNLRFKQKISLSINISEDYFSISIPTFILQPIIENSVIHGLEPKKENRCVELTAEKLANYIIIRVRDNGSKIDDTLLQQLNESLLKNSPDFNNRIGISNVNSRLKLYYGEDCGLSINSTNADGTTVSIKLKVEHNTLKLL